MASTQVCRQPQGPKWAVGANTQIMADCASISFNGRSHQIYGGTADILDAQQNVMKFGQSDIVPRHTRIGNEQHCREQKRSEGATKRKEADKTLSR